MPLPPSLSRRTLLAHAAAGATLAGLGTRAGAQPDWPARPIKFIVPYAAGGVTDVTMRMVGKHVEARIGQPLVVENRGGAGGAIGMGAVAKAAPDGYTIGGAAGSTVIQTPLMHEVAYSGDDFAYVCQLALVPMMLAVRASLPVRTAAEFRQYVLANKNLLTYGSTSAGHYAHLGMLELTESLQAGMELALYKGETPMLQDLLGGHLHCAFMAPTSIKAMVDAGHVRMLGVSGVKRVRAFPELPTLLEQGWTAPIYRMNPGWVGVTAPAQTPPAIVERLGREFAAAVHDPEIAAKLIATGLEPVGSSAAEFGAAFRAERPVWRELLKKADLKLVS